MFLSLPVSFCVFLSSSLSPSPSSSLCLLFTGDSSVTVCRASLPLCLDFCGLVGTSLPSSPYTHFLLISPQPSNSVSSFDGFPGLQDSMMAFPSRTAVDWMSGATSAFEICSTSSAYFCLSPNVSFFLPSQQRRCHYKFSGG